MRTFDEFVKSMTEDAIKQPVSQGSKTAEQWAAQLGMPIEPFLQKVQAIAGNVPVNPRSIINPKIINRIQGQRPQQQQQPYDAYAGDYDVQRHDARNRQGRI